MKSLMVLAAAASLAATVAIAGTSVAPPEAESTQIAKRGTPGGGYPYQLFLPKGYNASPDQKWPLVIFLHGSGERGIDLELVKKNGPPKIIVAHPGSPFILVSPQLELVENNRWDTAKLDTMLAWLRLWYRVDPRRIYLTGLSLGGYGAWNWALKRPDLFAAIVPVAANSEDKSLDPCALKDMPIWAFHGDQDDVVDPLQGFAIVKAVDACKGSVRPRMTIYPQMTHGSWDPAYDDPAMWRWLLEQRRTVPAPEIPQVWKITEKKAKK